MKALVSLLAVLVVTTAAIGVSLRSDGQPRGDAAAQHPGQATAISSDYLADLQSGVLRLTAYQALEDGFITFSSKSHLEGPTSGINCSARMAMLEAPVDNLLARSQGRPETATSDHARALGGTSGGGGGAATDLVVQDIRAPSSTTGSFGSSAETRLEGELLAGQWLLFVSGHDGINVAELDAESSWTVDVTFSGALQEVELPSSTLWCGNLRDLSEIELAYTLPVLGTHQTGGHLELTSPYGTTVMGRGNPFSAGSGTGSVTVGGSNIDLNSLADPRTWTFDGRDTIVVDVESWDDNEGPWLTLFGMWWPFVAAEDVLNP